MNTPKVLILGGGGMLGHKAFQVFSERFDTKVTFRDFSAFNEKSVFPPEQIIDRIDAFDIDGVEQVLAEVKPNIVLNCIGVIKQLKEASLPRMTIYINSLFPHLLAELCAKAEAKLIQISTDCVFSGDKGDYSEDDISDARDLYGRTKYLGEVDAENALTLRTSIIGHELFSNVSLVDWFLSQQGKSVNGFAHAIYTGFPTVVFAQEVARVIEFFPNLTGVYNVSSEKISKLNLLELICAEYSCQIEIHPQTEFVCDRSLNSGKYSHITGFSPTSWETMISEMHQDYLSTKY